MDRDESGRLLPGHGVGEGTRFEAGNRWWAKRVSPGRKPPFATAEALNEAADEYFAAAEDNPVMAAQIVGRDPTLMELPKRRALSIERLCLFLGVGRRTWQEWRPGGASEQPHLWDAMDRIETEIFADTYEGAAAGVIEPRVAMAKIGLAERREMSGGITVVMDPSDGDL